MAQLKNLPSMRRPGFYPWVRKIPWRRERLPTPVFWPGEFHGLYSPWGHKESDTTERPSLHWHRIQVSCQIFPALSLRVLTMTLLEESPITRMFPPSLCGMQDLSFPTRDWTGAPYIGSLNHWTTKEVPQGLFFFGWGGSSLLHQLFSSCSMQGLLLL